MSNTIDKYLGKKVAEDAGDDYVFDSLEMDFIKGKIHLVKTSPLFKSDAKFREYNKKAWEAAKKKPEFAKLSATPEYKELEKLLNKTVAEDAGYFHFSAKASRLVRPIIPKVERIALECREAFGGSAEDKNKNVRDAQELQRILNWLESAASYC